MSADIEYEKIGVASTGERFRVWDGDTLLCKSTKNPLCDAARELSKRGVTGRVRMRPKGNPATRWHIKGLIAVLASLTISENANHGPRLVKYKRHFAEGV